jgi:hypothetical protein
MYYEGGATNSITIGRDMGWVGISSVNIPTRTLNFGSRVQDFLLYLCGNDYGFGINGGTLRYNTAANAVHKFYSGSTNTMTLYSNGGMKLIGLMSSYGIRNKMFDQPLIFSYTIYIQQAIPGQLLLIINFIHFMYVLKNIIQTQAY